MSVKKTGAKKMIADKEYLLKKIREGKPIGKDELKKEGIELAEFPLDCGSLPDHETLECKGDNTPFIEYYMPDLKFKFKWKRNFGFQ